MMDRPYHPTHRLIFWLLAVALSFGPTWRGTAQQVVAPDSAAYYAGKEVTVCAAVAGTYLSQKKQYIAYLNLERPYPESPLTAVIFETGLERFDYDPVEALRGKTICITGRVELYKGKPQIVVNFPGQIALQSWKATSDAHLPDTHREPGPDAMEH